MAASDPVIRIGQVAVNLEAKTSERTAEDGSLERVSLTPTEWNLLEMLVTHPGRGSGSACRAGRSPPARSNGPPWPAR